MVWDSYQTYRNQIDKDMSNIILNLEISELVIVPIKNLTVLELLEKGALIQYNIIKNNQPKIYIGIYKVIFIKYKDISRFIRINII